MGATLHGDDYDWIKERATVNIDYSWQEEREARAAKFKWQLDMDLARTSATGEESERLRKLLATTVFPVRFAMYPRDKSGAPPLEDLTPEALRQKLQAIEDDGSPAPHKREQLTRSALLELGVIWPRNNQRDLDGLAFIGFMLLGETSEDALRRTALRRGLEEHLDTVARNIRRFYDRAGLEPTVPIPSS